MKKTITLFRLLVVAGLLLSLSGANKVWASHEAIISNISYVNVGPNVYLVNYKIHWDCNTASPPAGSTFDLTYRAPGCDSVARIIPLNLQPNSTVTGNPYCASTTLGPCFSGSGSLPYFQEQTYAAIITIPVQCSNWIISTRFGYRTRSRNLENNWNGRWNYLYAEASVNNLATPNNSSPGFGINPVPFAGVDKGFFHNQGIIEPDGDSVVYNITPALTDFNTPVVYGNYTGSGSGTNPYPAGISPAGTAYPSGNFSATNPIISRNPIALDRLVGNFVFEPLAYVGQSSPANLGLDRYLLAFKLEEYRKINGVQTKVGHVYREMMVFVADFGQNSLPWVDSMSINGNPYQISSIKEVVAGQPLTITLKTLDHNLADVVTLTSNVTNSLPGATFTISGGARPTGTISWTPTAVPARNAPYFFTITVTDNACPVKGFQTFTYGLRVNNTGGVNGISKALSSGSFTAYPNPSDGNEVTFKITNQKAEKNAEVVIYNLAGKVVDKVKAGADQVIWQKKADLPAGVYFARYTSLAGTWTVKLVHLK